MSYDLKLQNGDIILNEDSDVALITDKDKAIQDAIKIMITPQNSNKFYGFYGSLLNERLLGRNFDAQEMTQLLTVSIAEAIGTLMKLQAAQKQYQAVTPSEQIVELKKVSVVRDTVEPRQLNVFVSLVLGDGSTVTDNLQMRIG